MGEFSAVHWLVVIVVVAIFFGPRRLPELGAGLGAMISNFKKAFKDSDQSSQVSSSSNVASSTTNGQLESSREHLSNTDSTGTSNVAQEKSEQH